LDVIYDEVAEFLGIESRFLLSALIEAAASKFEMLPDGTRRERALVVPKRWTLILDPSERR